MARMAARKSALPILFCLCVMIVAIYQTGGASGAPGEAAVLPLEDGWEATEDVYWLGPDRVAAIARRRVGAAVETGLLTARLPSPLSLALPLGDPGHCREPSGTFLLRERAGDGEARLVRWSPGRAAAEATAEPVAEPDALARCRAALADTNARLEARLGRQVALATDGRRHAGLVPAGDTASEILLYDEDGAVLARWTVAPDLWRDPVVVEPLPSGAGFLIYPIFGERRREALRASVPGVPVHVVTEDGRLERTAIPWGDWSASGTYRIAPTAAGWVVAVMDRPAAPRSGLYAEAAGWAQVRAADLLPETLRVSPDGCRGLWLERSFDAGGAARRVTVMDFC